MTLVPALPRKLPEGSHLHSCPGVQNTGRCRYDEQVGGPAWQSGKLWGTVGQAGSGAPLTMRMQSHEGCLQGCGS